MIKIRNKNCCHETRHAAVSGFARPECVGKAFSGQKGMRREYKAGELTGTVLGK